MLHRSAPHAVIDTARQQLDMTEGELWDGYRAFGGTLSREIIEAFLRGASAITKEDIDSLALVLNDRFTGESSESPPSSTELR